MNNKAMLSGCMPEGMAFFHDSRSGISLPRSCDAGRRRSRCPNQRFVTMHMVIAYILAFLAASLPVFAADLPAPDPGAVTFSLVKPDARDVTLAGSFNQWDHEQLRLAGPDRHGRWTITLPLAPGRYEYLFVVNSTDWVPDPAAPSVNDGLGGRNSVLLVPDRER